MQSYKTTALNVWGWWGSDKVAALEGLRAKVDLHIQDEVSAGWDLVSLNFLDTASNNCAILVWRR